jgi:hypothetical protein
LSWSLFNFSTAIIENITLVAQWHTVVYTITYKDGETILSWLSPTTYTIEDNISVLPIPTKVGYVFSGWLEGGNSISNIPVWTYGDKVLQAQRKSDINNNGIADEEEEPWLVTVHYVYSRWWSAWADKTWVYLSGLAFSITW